MSNWRTETIAEHERELELLDVRLQERFPSWAAWLLPVVSAVLGILLWSVEITDDLTFGATGLGIGFLLMIAVGDYTSQTERLKERRNYLRDRIDKLKQA